MNRRKLLGIALIVIIFLGLCGTVAYVIIELKDETDITIQQVENTDAVKFKKEYEDLNDKQDSDGVSYRTVSIDESNPIKYTTASDIVTKIDNKETFAVYFGYSESPLCRNIVESLIKSAKNSGVSNLFYVDIKSIRDNYELDENHEAKRTVEGTEGYYSLLNKLDNVLKTYEPLIYTHKNKVGKTINEKISIDEKRIYEPTIITIKNGTDIELIDRLSSDLGNDELTDEIKKSYESEFNDLFKQINTTTTGEVCTPTSNC